MMERNEAGCTSVRRVQKRTPSKAFPNGDVDENDVGEVILPTGALI